MSNEEFNKKWTRERYLKATESENLWKEYIDDCFQMYEDTGFSETFHSPYDSEKIHNGKPFKVIRRANESEGDIEAFPLWLVKFYDEDESTKPYYCYPEEICKIEEKTL